MFIRLGLMMLMMGLAAPIAEAQTALPLQSFHRSLFISPMGAPYRSDDRAKPGIDLWLEAADADHDAKLSEAEFLADAQRFFAIVDANHDGAATSAESTMLWRRRAPEILAPVDMEPPMMDEPDLGGDSHRRGHGSEARQRMPGPVAPLRHGAARFGLLTDAEPVMSCDSDFDRRVTAAEFEACASLRFRRLDANADGFFALDEAQAPL